MKNVILLFADDMRYGLIDNPEVHTPNIEKLASKGLMYSNAHIPGGTSGAVCMPSRAMLHTGRLLEGLVKAGRTIPDEHTMLGEVLRNNGYETHGIGKWHNGTDSYTRSFSSGAEIFFGGMEDHWNVPANNYDPTGKYPNIIHKSTNAYFQNSIASYHCDHITPGKHSSELFADASIDFLNKQKEKDKPFFLYTAFMAPHDPRTMPEKYLKMYNPDGITLPANYKPEHPFDFGVSQIRDELLAPYPRTEKEIRKQLTEYYAMVTHLDACVGRILDSIEENGFIENTIVIFAADNGLAVGSHGLMGKQNLYEHSIRVPLILRGPGIPEGDKENSPVFIAGLYPTILNILRLDVPDTCTANSYKTMYSDINVNKDALHFRYKNYIAGIKKDGYKLIKYMMPEKTILSLFNYIEDPNEISNLIFEPQYTNLINGLLHEIEVNWTEIDI